MASAPPLTGVRVLEFAGLAPGPFAGLLLADYGATVLRVDRAHPAAHRAAIPTLSGAPAPPTRDKLTRHKSSITVDFKSPAGLALIRRLLLAVDVVIDPYRPGVLEKLSLGPALMLALNPRLVVARMTGYRRDGKYAAMAGHDINYIAVSGVLSMLGRRGEKPYAPANILGDFAGGGAVCFMGILLALLERQRSGRGQVVEANMVDGAAYLATFPRLAMKEWGPASWAGERGTNMLDGGSPFYDTYETKDGKYMSVGALEPQFFAELLRGLGLREKDLPGGTRDDPSRWSEMAALFTETFKGRTRKEWEDVFDGTDACVAPVLEQGELEQRGFDQRPIVTLRESPGRAIAKVEDASRIAAQGQGSGVKGEGWSESGLAPGVGGAQVLQSWMGWTHGKEYDVEKGGLTLLDAGKSKI